MSIVISHPTGNANVRAVLRALVKGKRLHSFWTGLAVPPPVCTLSVLGTNLQRDLGRRAFSEVRWSQIRMSPFRELARVGATRLGLGRLIRHEVGWASVDRVYDDLDRRVADFISRSHRGLTAVYAYEDGAYHSFSVARASGLKRIYDLPIAHWQTLRRLLQEEALLNPAWAPSMEGLVDSAEKLKRKDQELRLASHVVVASSFTRRSVEEHFGSTIPITVTPYGAPAALVSQPKKRSPDEPLHVLYAGHLSQRKGIAYLIEAMRKATIPWRLTLAGPRPNTAPPELDVFLDDERCTWLGHVPHPTLMEAMCQAHVFVFPSIVEGFGMVLYEAMAAGLPVITTPNTAAPDIMIDGREGFIVPIRDPAAITARLTQLYEDEMGREEMADAALACASKSRWDEYERNIGVVLDRLDA